MSNNPICAKIRQWIDCKKKARYVEKACFSAVELQPHLHP